MNRVYPELRALHKQSIVCEVHLLPTADRPQTQLTLAMFVIFSRWNFLDTFFWGAHSPEKEKNEKPFILFRIEKQIRHVASSIRPVLL